MHACRLRVYRWLLPAAVDMCLQSPAEFTVSTILGLLGVAGVTPHQVRYLRRRIMHLLREKQRAGDIRELGRGRFKVLDPHEDTDDQCQAREELITARSWIRHKHSLGKSLE